MPTWEAWRDECADLLPNIPVTLPELNGRRFRRRPQKVVRGAHGADGWRVAEALALPHFILQLVGRPVLALGRRGRSPPAPHSQHAAAALTPRDNSASGPGRDLANQASACGGKGICQGAGGSQGEGARRRSPSCNASG